MQVRVNVVFTYCGMFNICDSFLGLFAVSVLNLWPFLFFNLAIDYTPEQVIHLNCKIPISCGTNKDCAFRKL